MAGLKEMLRQLKLWNRWRKRNLNGFRHQILVLFGIIHSPTFEVFRIWDGGYEND